MYLLTKNQDLKIQHTICKESIHKPNSVLCGHLSLATIVALRPTHRLKETDSFLQKFESRLLGLAPGGACRSLTSQWMPVSSYLTFSPLPRYIEAVCFLWRLPSPLDASLLASTLSCGVRTFLISYNNQRDHSIDSLTLREKHHMLNLNNSFNNVSGCWKINLIFNKSTGEYV